MTSDSTWNTQIERFKQTFGVDLLEVRMPGLPPTTDVPILYVTPTKLPVALRFLKTQIGFAYEFLSDLTATDEQPSEPRFEIVYNLFSPMHRLRIRVKARVSEGASVPSICDLWQGAEWAEREVFDMYGIVFSEHPDLRRILNDPRFQGHPLRKDYHVRKYQIFEEAEPPNLSLLERKR